MTQGGEKHYWFKAKKYGWGWGLPANRKGWIAFSVFLGVWLAALLWLVSTGSPTEQLQTKDITVFLVILFADIVGLLFVSFKYGEPPKWRWGSKHDAAKSRPD